MNMLLYRVASDSFMRKTRVKHMLSKQHVASFDIDAQNTFTPRCPNELPVPEGDGIVAELNAQAAWAKWRIGSKDAHSPHAIWVSDAKHPPLSRLNAPQADIYWPVHAVPGTPGFELIAGLPKPEKYDYFVWKGVELDLHPYGACYHDLQETLSTGVIEFLQAHAITTVIVGGLATDYCVKTTVLQLCRTGITVIVNLAACRGIDSKTTEIAINDMQAAGALTVACADELADYIKSQEIA